MLKNVEITVGKIMSVVAECALRIAIIVVGISCIDEEFITSNIVLFFGESIFFEAFIPAGVPALPIPRKFAERLTDKSA